MYSNKTKRIVAIHDLCGVGRVSLSVVIPILTTMGFRVSPLPTAILSNHTQYPSFSFFDLTEEMTKIINEWKRQEMEFDAFYSGYLGSPQQVNIVKKFIDNFRNDDSLVVIDPVLGDNGKLYAGFDHEIVKEMRRLIRTADVITPNLTEFFYLLDMPFETISCDDRMKELLLQLSDKGSQIIVVTNVPVPNDPRTTSVYVYNRRGDRFWKITCPYLPAHYPGVGDTFTSVMTGALMQGDSLPMALDRAAQFCYQGIRATYGYDHNTREGIMLEKVLQNLNIPIQITSYELI